MHVRYDLGDEAGLAECFEGLAGVELASGAPGARRHPARRRRRPTAEHTGSAASAAEVARVATLLTDARSLIDDAAFSAAYARGVEQSVAGAVEHALDGEANG